MYFCKPRIRIKHEFRAASHYGATGKLLEAANSALPTLLVTDARTITGAMRTAGVADTAAGAALASALRPVKVGTATAAAREAIATEIFCERGNAERNLGVLGLPMATGILYETSSIQISRATKRCGMDNAASDE
jgi:hypothetical protein